MYLNSELNQLKLGAAGDLGPVKPGPGREIWFNQHQPGSAQLNTDIRHQQPRPTALDVRGENDDKAMLMLLFCYKQTISVFPVLGMVQTGQSSVQGTGQSS